ncbi:MAG: transposase, partial [bacterium]
LFLLAELMKKIELLEKLAKRLEKRITISLDSSIYEVFGNCKEKSSQSFKNIFGFHPLFLHIHDTGELLDIVFRGGKAFTSNGAAQMLKDNIDRLTPYFDEIILLADSGFYENAEVKHRDSHAMNYRMENLKQNLKKKGNDLRV